ncbi:MAG: rhamnulokinase [Kiritimatiellia bacterium]
MTEKRLFAVDLGASGGKCFVGSFAAGGFRMEETHRFAHEGVSFFLPDRTGTVTERTCWDDTHIYQQIIRGLQAFRRNVGARLDSIGVDTWGADGQFFSADSEMLGKVYCYRDHRLDNMIAAVKARMDARRIYEITGIHFQPFNVSNQLLWFVTYRRDLLKPSVRYLPIPTVFNYYLGGCTQVDSTFASVTQLMDARRRQWSGPILRALGIPRKLLPEIVAPGTRIGQLFAPLAASVGLNTADIVAVGSHDTASAFAAAPVKNPGRALIISSGTWSLIGRLVRHPITNDAALAANLSNEGGIGNTRLLKNCMGTWLVQELLRGWAVTDGKLMAWDEVTRLAAAAPAFAMLIDPNDPSFYNPPDMEKAIRTFLARTQQPAPTTRGAVLRCVYESLALKYRIVNSQIESVTGTATEVVHIVGGGSRNELLNQFTANALGVRVLAGPEEATAVGNLMVQAVGIGILPDLAQAQPLIQAAFTIKAFKPADTPAWLAAADRFRQLLPDSAL